ncbi:hypothetical protein [Leptolyngbya sp. FACHB-671]|nr:hypothetical protein [Leptolyngbya sp. FACHB-671]
MSFKLEIDLEVQSELRIAILVGRSRVPIADAKGAFITQRADV